MIRAIYYMCVIFYFLICFLATTKGGLTYGIVAATFGLCLYPRIKKYTNKWMHRELLEEYATIIENIVVHSYDEGDDTVYNRAKEELQLLVESGNTEYKNDNLKIHCFFYQSNKATEDHINIKSNNTYIKSHLIQCASYDQFLELVDKWQEEDNARQHKAIAQESNRSGDWYIKNALGQL